MNLDRLKYRYWQHTDWHDTNSPLEAVYCNAVDGCDPTIAVSDFEFCTGLKDKNGTLIYEGDVVICDRDFSENGRKNLIRKVIFADGSFQLERAKTIGDRYYINAFHNFEIIGNIHEQAEQKDTK